MYHSISLDFYLYSYLYFIYFFFYFRERIERIERIEKEERKKECSKKCSNAPKNPRIK